MKYGLQLYTVRDDFAKSPIETLEKIAAMGYEGVEFAGYANLKASELRKELDRLGLQAVSSHVSLELLESSLEDQVQYAKEIGCSYLVCPYLGEDCRTDEQAWKKTFARLAEIGKKVTALGLQFGYHNHAFEFEQNVDGQFAFDAMFASAPSEELFVEMDVCWVQYAGQEPVQYIGKYKGRLPLLHLKDVRTQDRSKFDTVELGQGDVDLHGVINASSEAGVQWLIVEQDNCSRPPLESVEASMQWLKTNNYK